MADLLVMHPDYVHYDPSLAGAYLSGMVVDVFPDGQLGPGNNQHPRFVIVRLPGVPKEDVLDLLDAIKDQDNIMIKRRSKKINWSSLNNPTMKQIRNEREITVPETWVRDLLEVIE